jgi:biofilm PGA synthesis N-glycosyltransferase PgaC
MLSVKYVALTSCRNEERFIQRTIRRVLSQDPPPSCYVVVDDASTDNTAAIISEENRVELLSLHNPRHPIRGVNLAWALNAGVERVTEFVPEWDFLLKVDADSVLPVDYFQQLLYKLEGNPSLGIVSGMPFDEKVWRGRASDGAKVYRRKCLDDISPFYPCNAFDTLAFLQAKKHNWNVESFPEIKYVQLRTWRRRRLSRWVLSGRSRYYLGFPSWHTFLISFVYAKHRPPIIGSLSMFLSHLFTRIGSPRRPLPDDYYSFVPKYALQEALERLRERRII